MTNNSLHPDSAAGGDAKSSTQRARWATRRMTVRSGGSKRIALLNRMQQGKAGPDEKGDGRSPGHDPNGGQANAAGDDDDENHGDSRMLFFNLPLTPDLLDDDGAPVHTYARNKIRTAKYTPLSFVPKNLWFQFHNIANIFFLFLVIIVVSSRPALPPEPLIRPRWMAAADDPDMPDLLSLPPCSISPYLEERTRSSTWCP